MLSEKDYIKILKVIDPFFIALTTYLTFRSLFIIDEAFISYVLILTVLGNFLFSRLEIYKSYQFKSLYGLMFKVISGCFIYFSLTSTLIIYFKKGLVYPLDRFIYLLLINLTYFFIVHLLMRKHIRNQMSIGFNRKRVIFFGNSKDILKFIKLINSYQFVGCEIVAFFGETKSLKPEANKQIENYLGDIEDMKLWLNNNLIDQIYFSHDYSYEIRVEELLKIFGNTSLPVIFMPNWIISGMKLRGLEIGNRSCLQIWGEERSYVNFFAKRVFDITISSILIILLTPFLALTAVSIKFTSKGNILFTQIRFGINGKRFRIYKFRTMYSEYCGKDIRQAKKNDKRITKFGSFLRKWSIDELPQLFNVLKGDMSLVGPRPHAEEHNEMYRELIVGYMQRHSLMPGITGLAQVEGLRGETSKIFEMEERIKSDLRYQSQWSLFLDMKILIRTLLNIKSKKSY